MFRLWPARFAVQGVDRQAGLLIFSVRNFFVRDAANAVLRRKQRDQFDVWRFAQDIDRLAAAAIASGVISYQTDAQAGQLFETVALQHIDAGQNLSIRDRGATCVCRARV